MAREDSFLTFPINFVKSRTPNELDPWLLELNTGFGGTKRHQAVDEKVDGGVDYGQVPGDKVSEPLMTLHHLLGLVFDV